MRASAVFKILLVSVSLVAVAGKDVRRVQKVVYHEGATDEEKVSSSLEEIPPRDEWFRVRGDHPQHQHQQQRSHEYERDVVVSPTNRSPAKAVVISDRRGYNNNEERVRGGGANNRQVHVNVRNRGKVGFQNDRGLKEEVEDDVMEENNGDWEEITKVPPLSKLNNNKGGRQKQQNWHLHIRHEGGRARVESNRPREPQEPDEESFSDSRGNVRGRYQEPVSQSRSRYVPPVETVNRNDEYDDYEEASTQRNVNNGGRHVEALAIHDGDDDRGTGGHVVLLKTSRDQSDVGRMRESAKNYVSERDSDSDTPPPPPHEQVAKMARYIVHHSNWTSVATISTMDSVKGYPFVNIFSISDGPVNNSSGTPYMYLTPLDMSVTDLKTDSRASLTMSLAQSDYCRQQQYDPEDPRCAKVILSGRIMKVSDSEEKKFARNALYTKHPDMQDWPKDHGWFFAKLDIENVIVLDYFGGAKTVNLDDYFNQSSL